jgi:hypothetical protein
MTLSIMTLDSDCPYAECRYADCRGTLQNADPNLKSRKRTSESFFFKNFTRMRVFVALNQRDME